MSLFDDVKKNLIEWYNVTTEKTSEVARVTSRRYDKFGISRDIERQFSELGSLVYNGLKEGRADLLQDAAVRALVDRLDELETELRAKDEEIDAIRRDYARRKGRAAGTVEAILEDPVLSEGSAASAILIEPDPAEDEDEGEWGPERDTRET